MEIPHMVTIKEAAEITGLTYYMIRNLCLQKQITFIKSGNKYFINMDRFAEYLNRKIGE